MAMLDRYRKKGGFKQLLILVETCGPAKQEKFLELIRAEDPRWADALQFKMLDMSRIYSWTDQTLAEIFGTLQDLTVAVALHAADDVTRKRITAFFSHSRMRKIDDLIETHKPTPREVSAMHMKIIESVRKMVIDGSLRAETFDPGLSVEDGIEDQLAKSLIPPTSTQSGFASVAAPTKMEEISSEVAQLTLKDGNDSHLLEMQALRKKVAELGKENAFLRHELSVAKGKLDQIKKIA